jgi:hypothetical protein
VVGDQADMTGHHVDNLAEGFVGELNRWAVQDHGEGSNAGPDLVSRIPHEPG